ncbi:MAG: hypothetical protein MJ010_06850 [Paludibacteraceae bacterium]|nr:hypothetical protein [Paludibacteraceae bacterium]
MEIKIEKGGHVISNFLEWELYGKPKSLKQWKSGRSSMEMAKFALSNEFKDMISELLSSLKIKEQDFNCEPEATTSLGRGFGKGGCRNHDLLMIGEDCVIGIEAKVSESFGKPVKEVLAKQQIKHIKLEKTRVYKLYNYLFPSKINDIQKCYIGYQLLTATMGTLRVAHDKNYKNAIFLVVVFARDDIKEKNYIKNCKKNNMDFEAFDKLINPNRIYPKHIDDIDLWALKREI